MGCERIETYSFLKRISSTLAISEPYNTKLCNGEFTRCARYVVFKVCGDVPDDLYPSMHNRQLISVVEVIICDLSTVI